MRLSHVDDYLADDLNTVRLDDFTTVQNGVRVPRYDLAYLVKAGDGWAGVKPERWAALREAATKYLEREGGWAADHAST